MLVESFLIFGTDCADSDRAAVAQFGIDDVFSRIDAHVLIYHWTLSIMDIQMPVMDGHAATRAIRDWERDNQRTPAALLEVIDRATA